MDTNISRRKYKKSPIVEVVCEIHFKEFQDASKISDELYELLKEKYPKRIQGHRIFLDNAVDNENKSPEVKKFEAWRFSNESGTELIQFSGNTLGINSLESCYEGFEVFSENVRTAIQSYNQVVKTASIERLGLRYINKISIDIEHVELEEYFYSYPAGGENILSFELKFEKIPFYEDHNLFVTMSSPEVDDTPFQFLIDIDNTFIETNDSPNQDILKILKDGHENIGRTFEAMITDKTRAILEEDKDADCAW